MDLSFVVVQMLTGLASASSLFIIASGLTIVFGVTRIVNFAHGSLYMLGAYFAVTLVPRLLDLSHGPLSFWAGILISALAVGLLGVAMEVLLLRRIYRAPELFQLSVPPHEGREPARRRAFEPRPHGARADDFIDVDRRAQPLDLDGSQRLDGDVAFGKP